MPTEPADLEWAANRGDVLVNYVESARDQLMSEEAAHRLSDEFDEHFVQGWHGKQEQYRAEHGTYTSGRRVGRLFAWYWDRESKATGTHCFHLEARYQGVAAVRRIGIHHPRDLLTFDHEDFWLQYLRLYRVDLEKLGRCHLNHILGERRRQPLLYRWPRHPAPFVYNLDRSTGSILYRVYASHSKQGFRSVQRFVDSYGRGSFLVPHSHMFMCDNSSFAATYLDPQCEFPIYPFFDAHPPETEVRP